MIHIVKGFGTINKAEIVVFLELSSFFDDSADVGNLISGSSALSKSSLNVWKKCLNYGMGINESPQILGSSVSWREKGVLQG